MNVLVSVFTTMYLIVIIIEYYLKAINGNTYYICLGLWAVMFILIQVWSNHNERW